ncbi:MAG: killer suppression protein [bacterium]|nr:killer suppression protein [bacterium]
MEYVVEIAFRSYRIEALCSSEKALRRKYGQDGARKIKLRLSQLEAVETLEAMRGIARCHELTHDRRGQLALDLHRGFRLIVEPAGDWRSKRDGGLDWRSVSETVVVAIEDYH